MKTRIGQIRTVVFWTCFVVLLFLITWEGETRKIYWTDGSGIHCAEADGTNRKTLLSVQIGNPQEIALDTVNGKIYWTDRGTRRIKRANLDGADIEEILTTGDYPKGVAIDTVEGKIYWIEAGWPRQIQRANLDGTGIEAVPAAVGRPRRIAVDAKNQQVFWTEAGQIKIQRISFDGTGLQSIFVAERGQGGSLPMAITAEKLYWSVYNGNSKTASFRRADFDGNNEEDVMVGITPSVTGLALD